MHLEVIADDSPIFSSYRPDPDDFTLVNERGETWAWDRSACGLPAFIPMLGRLEKADFSVTFTIPEDAGRLWLRYQPHDTKIDTSWGLGKPSQLAHRGEAPPSSMAAGSNGLARAAPLDTSSDPDAQHCRRIDRATQPIDDSGVKLCTVCGVVTSRAGSRCTEHARQSNRSRHNALSSTRAWQHLSARVLRCLAR